MADYSDDDIEIPKQRVENQPYDETLEVPDAEDVASVYTPTPRNPKQHHQAQQQQHHLQVSNRQQSNRQTPPPTSSSVSSGGSLHERNPNQQNVASRGPISYSHTSNSQLSKNMNPTPSPDTPKEDFRNQKRAVHQQQQQQQQQDDMEDSGTEENESGDDSQYNSNELAGGYDPSAFKDLPVSSEIKDIFKYIERYQPQNIELDFKLKPFIPDYIPSIGDIDAFIKVPRPDGREDGLGLLVVDEPSSNQSDPHVLDLFFRTLSKQSTSGESNQPTSVKSVEGSNVKAIESWIRNISALQKNKPIQTVSYQRAMPSIDSLMQVWPQEFEELVKEISLPSSELNVDLNTFIDLICAILDIPVYKSRVQSVHVLFSLFSEFKNSEYFKSGNQTLNPYASTNLKGNQAFESNTNGGARNVGGKSKVADQLVID